MCGHTLKDFIDLNKKTTESRETLKFGVSILHARIRFFESLLDITYKIPIKNGKQEQKVRK